MTTLKYIKDVRKVLDGHEKIRIERLSKKKSQALVYSHFGGGLMAESVVISFRKSWFDFKVVKETEHGRMLMARGGYGKVLTQTIDADSES